MADEHYGKPSMEKIPQTTPSKHYGKPSMEKIPQTTPSKTPSPKHKFEGHADDIESFIFLHDDKHIVSSSRGTMCKWDCETGLLVGEPWEGEGGTIWTLALSPNGEIIACGRDDGRIQQWNTDGKMMNGDWMGHKNKLVSVSWSPSGGHIASGSCDGTILIRKADSGEVEVGPIDTRQQFVDSLAYSPSGDRIASGGENETICIWDSNTGDLLVGPIKDSGILVISVVWSSDSSKLYSASGKFARVFDSVSGTELHRFKHNNFLNSVALSPKHNLLACVGIGGTAQLWDTESYQPLGKPFSPEDNGRLECMSFSRDGRYLAYGGNGKITLWMVEDIAPQFALPDSATQEVTLPVDVDATDPFARLDDIEDGHDDPYNDNFFQSSHSSLHLSSFGPSPIRRWWRVIVVASLLRTPANEPVPLQRRLKRRFLIRRASLPSPLEAPANNEPTEPKPNRKVRAREEHDKDVHLPDRFANIMPGPAKQDKGKQREDLPDPVILPPNDAFSTAELDANENLTFPKFLRALGKYARTSPVQMTPGPSLKVVEVSVCRKHQGHVAVKRKHKAKSSSLRTSALTTAAQASGSSQAGPSSHGRPAHGNTSSLGQAVVSSQSIVAYGGQSLQVAESITTVDDLSDSDSMQGSWNKFLDKLCFPCGHYHDH